MNKDLEKIKENAILLLQLDPECSEACDLMDECQKEIIVAAERMAAEIEQLKEEVNETQTVYYSVLKDNTRLKAELEKRPDIVRCMKCKRYRKPSCPWHRTLIMHKETDYCSFGEISEREEKR